MNVKTPQRPKSGIHFLYAEGDQPLRGWPAGTDAEKDRKIALLEEENTRQSEEIDELTRENRQLRREGDGKS